MNIETLLQQAVAQLQLVQLEQVEKIRYRPGILRYEHEEPTNAGSVVVLRLPIQSPDF